MPDYGPWFYVLYGAAIIGAIVFYVWLKRQQKRMEEIFDRRSAEILQEYEEAEAPYWESIARYEDQSLQALKAAERGEQVDMNLSRSIAYALQAQITRNQLEDL